MILEGWGNFSRLSDSKSVFLFVNENMSWMLTGTVSFNGSFEYPGLVFNWIVLGTFPVGRLENS